jgi:hypothetical protein
MGKSTLMSCGLLVSGSTMLGIFGMDGNDIDVGELLASVWLMGCGESVGEEGA